uniref:F180B protein n=1 Tax=Nothoprocta perdicaria TaxID=30464 RepID=A0A8C6ZB49_NOTPE
MGMDSVRVRRVLGSESSVLLSPTWVLSNLRMVSHLHEGLYGTVCWQVTLLFQMLWAGLEIEANRTRPAVQLRDEELASLRPARRFLQVFENEVPKTPAEIEQQLHYYSLTDTPLPIVEFDRLLFTSVYCAYQIRSIQGLDKNLWISLFSQLVDEIFRDLCKGVCPANSTLLLDKAAECISPFPLCW